MSFDYEEYFAKQYPFWNKLSTSDQAAFIQNSSVRTYEKGQFIHSSMGQCMGMLLVESGQLRVYIQSENGKEITLYRLDEGETCTLSSSCIMQEITFDVFITATQDSTLIVTNSSYLNQLASENIYVENYLYKQTTEKFSNVMWSMQQILFLSFDQRLAGYLYDEMLKTRSNVLVLTHDEIAKNLGSAREVVSRMLKYFQKEGIVTIERGKIIIDDKAKLTKLAM